MKNKMVKWNVKLFKPIIVYFCFRSEYWFLDLFFWNVFNFLYTKHIQLNSVESDV